MTCILCSWIQIMFSPYSHILCPYIKPVSSLAKFLIHYIVYVDLVGDKSKRSKNTLNVRRLIWEMGCLGLRHECMLIAMFFFFKKEIECNWLLPQCHCGLDHKLQEPYLEGNDYVSSGIGFSAKSNESFTS